MCRSPRFQASGAGLGNFGRSDSGACGFEKLTPCTAARPSAMRCVPPRPVNVSTFGGRASSRVMCERASWLPWITQTGIDASCRRFISRVSAAAVCMLRWLPS